MAISFVSTHSATGGSSTASIAVPAAATAGRVGLLTVSTSGTGAYTPPAGWSLVAAQPWWFDSRDTRLYVRVFGASESGSYSVGVPYSYWAVGLAIFDGVDTAAPIAGVGSANAYGTSHATGSVAVTGADRWLVGVWAGSDSQQVLSLPGTMTSRLSVAGGNTGQRLVIGSEAAGAGTYTRTGTTGSADDYAAYLVVLSPAAGSGGPVALAGALTGTGDLAATLTATGGGAVALSGALGGTGDLAAALSVSGGGTASLSGALSGTGDLAAALTVTGGGIVALSGALAGTGALAATVTAAAPGAWHWTEAERPLIDRIATVTIAATSGQGYLGASADGSTWSWYAGPLGTDGETLTAVASEAAARAAAVTLPANGRWRLPTPIDVRYVRLGHRATGGSYTLREFYPRRLVQSDDVEAEAIRAIHIGAGVVTADKLFGTDLGALRASLGQVTIDTSGFLRSGQTAYNTGSGFWLGNVGGIARFSLGVAGGHNLTWDGNALSVSGALNLSGVGTIGSSGGLYQGTGTFAAPTTGLKLWNESGIGRLATYNGGVAQVALGTDGALIAGAGRVRLDGDGMRYTYPGGGALDAALDMRRLDGSQMGGLRAQISGGGENLVDLFATGGALRLRGDNVQLQGYTYTNSGVAVNSGSGDAAIALKVRAVPASVAIRAISSDTLSPQVLFDVADNGLVQVYNRMQIGTTAWAPGNPGQLSIGDSGRNWAPNASTWGSDTTLLLTGYDFASIGFHDAGNRVDYILAGLGQIIVGFDGGFGPANTLHPGNGHAFGGAVVANQRVRITSTGDTSAHYPLAVVNSTASASLLLVRGDSVFQIAGTWANISDARLKTDILPISGALDQVRRWQPVSYRWTDGRADKRVHLGFLAQQIAGVTPELVHPDADDDGDLLTVNYTEAVPVVAAAVAELAAELASLRADLAALRARN